MCGLVGIASLNPVSYRDWLVAGRDLITHRGPDDAGEWWSDNGCVGLAHRRLSVLDLSQAGHQPMVSKNRQAVIVFNGEIYNYAELKADLSNFGYTFSSGTDTEILLAAYDFWGTDCLLRLEGMFAFAIYDIKQQFLFIARDRVGEKPLFYHFSNNTLRFGSELKAILADKNLPRRINPKSLDFYLNMGFIPGDLCVIDGFNKLPAAHALKFNMRDASLKVWRYWKLPDLNLDMQDSTLNKEDLLDQLDSLLESAVCRQMIADVPVGILLSGGVDSSLITAMAANSVNKVQTFTIGLPGNKSLDETEHARLIANYFGTCHTELEAEPISSDLLLKLAHQFDEPIADSSIIPMFMVSNLVKKYCTVALGGDGGDELFGGYKHYSRLLQMKSYSRFIPNQLRGLIGLGSEKLLPLGFRGGNWLKQFALDFNKELPYTANFFDSTARSMILSQHPNIIRNYEDKLINESIANQDLIQRATRMDFYRYLPDNILVKVDRASMMNSLELRAPFLDHRVVEFAFRNVPSNLKVFGDDRKILLKLLAKRRLPINFDNQRKQGFSIPLAQWLQISSFRSLFREVLLSGNSLFNRKMMEKLLAGQDLGRSNSERIFALFMFELWRLDYEAYI
jgi:asparagine synthase (glutamine-hydrolysing)